MQGPEPKDLDFTSSFASTQYRSLLENYRFSLFSSRNLHPRRLTLAVLSLVHYVSLFFPGYWGTGKCIWCNFIARKSIESHAVSGGSVLVGLKVVFGRAVFDLVHQFF
jgi:hypothetical protein